MATEMAPWTKRILEMADHGPVLYERVIARSMALVPPGRAFRLAEHLRQWEKARERRLGPTTRKRYDQVDPSDPAQHDQRVRVGARRLVTQAAWGQAKKGRIVIYYDDGQRYVKAGPKRPTR
jgi:hypothetical protein